MSDDLLDHEEEYASDDDESGSSDDMALYNQDAYEVNFNEIVIPEDMPQTIKEKYELEQMFWKISEDNVQELIDKLLDFVKKKESNQLLVVQLVDSVAIAKPKLIKLLAVVFKILLPYLPVDSELFWESRYINVYFDQLKLNKHKRFYRNRNSNKEEIDEENIVFLYPEGTFEYFTVWDDLEGFQNLECSSDISEERHYVEGESNLLDLAAKFGSVNIFKYLVNSANFDITQDTFLCAVKGGNLFIVRYCIQYWRSNINPQESIDNAVECNNLELVEWMISEYNILPTLSAPLARNTTNFFFPILSRAQYLNVEQISSAVGHALKSGYEEIAIYLIRKYDFDIDIGTTRTWISIGGYIDFLTSFLEITEDVRTDTICHVTLNLIESYNSQGKQLLTHPALKKYLSDIIYYAFEYGSKFRFLMKTGIDLEAEYKPKEPGGNLYLDIIRHKILYHSFKEEDREIFEKCFNNVKGMTQNYYSEMISNMCGNLLFDAAEYAMKFEKFKEFRPLVNKNHLLYNLLQNSFKFPGKQLVEKINFINSLEDDGSNDKLPLYHCKFNRVDEEAFRLIFNNLKNMNLRNRRSQTPLHRLYAAKNYPLAKVLLDMPGVNVNAKNSKGVTPFMLACMQYRNGNKELYDLIKLMMDLGADPKLKSCSNISATDIITANNRKTELLNLIKI